MPFIPGFYGTCEDGTGGAGTVSAPGQVTGLSVSVVSSSQLNLSWNAVSGATTYKVERSTSSGSGYSQITSTGSTTFNNTGLSASTTYYYRVRASNSAGDGSYSSVASGTTQSAGSAPSNVSVATSSTGNYDDAVIIDCITGSGVIPANSGSTFSSGTGDVELIYGPSYTSALNAGSGVLQFRTFGYCRATGATSFSWGMGTPSVVQDTNNAINSTSKSGSGSSAQDSTSTHIGITASITHNSGGRGYLLLQQSGDGFSWAVNCSAINSNGTTLSSPTVTVRVMIP
jgi:hypothetical protein